MYCCAMSGIMIGIIIQYNKIWVKIYVAVTLDYSATPHC